LYIDLLFALWYASFLSHHSFQLINNKAKKLDWDVRGGGVVDDGGYENITRNTKCKLY
jgi:hypothetical protein